MKYELERKQSGHNILCDGKKLTLAEIVEHLNQINKPKKK